MARIAGVDIPNDKPVGISLTYIYGIGRTTAAEICAACDIEVGVRVKNLTEEQKAALERMKKEGIRNWLRMCCIQRQK